MGVRVASPFKVFRPDGQFDDTHLAFAAEFDLPTDGTPNCVNKIRVEVLQEHAGDDLVEVRLLNVVNSGSQLLSSDHVAIKAIGSMLYAAARVRNVPMLELVS